MGCLCERMPENSNQILLDNQSTITKGKRAKGPTRNIINENKDLFERKPDESQKNTLLFTQLKYPQSPKDTSIHQTELDSYEATCIDTKNTNSKKQGYIDTSQISKYFNIFENEKHQSVITSKRKSSYQNNNNNKAIKRNNFGDLSNYYQLKEKDFDY